MAIYGRTFVHQNAKSVHEANFIYEVEQVIMMGICIDINWRISFGVHVYAEIRRAIAYRYLGS